ncbi:hypothetical protein DPMN_147988 [Dreissena polymorpha]|uniref:Uncharacterized protein n=1 Tax=Dreissena polymorpha TaxID=45954 RepID=A0A9D4F8X6_DREPO|nr:hypothetical protein DPMN_147988 [Dreissena polymorpha]
MTHGFHTDPTRQQHAINTAPTWIFLDSHGRDADKNGPSQHLHKQSRTFATTTRINTDTVYIRTKPAVRLIKDRTTL